MLQLIQRLVVQPNSSRAQTFAEAFISSGGIETLLVLLQREANAGDNDNSDPLVENNKEPVVLGTEDKIGSEVLESGHGDDVGVEEEKALMDEGSLESVTQNNGQNPLAVRLGSSIERMPSASDNAFLKNVGGIRFPISGENARNNVYNVDNSDGILVAIIGLLGALVTAGHLKFGSHAISDVTATHVDLLEGGGTMFDDKISLLHFSLQKAFQAAPNRLMTGNVYSALLGASVNDISLFPLVISYSFISSTFSVTSQLTLLCEQSTPIIHLSVKLFSSVVFI